MVDDTDVSTQTTMGKDASTIEFARRVTSITTSDDNTFSKKLNIPSFNGSDPGGWLAGAEQYFELHSTRSEQKVTIALICMEDGALHWLCWLHQCIPNLTWEQLTFELWHRYGANLLMNPYERLSEVKWNKRLLLIFLLKNFLSVLQRLRILQILSILAIFWMGWRKKSGWEYVAMIPLTLYAPWLSLVRLNMNSLFPFLHLRHLLSL